MSLLINETKSTRIVGQDGNICTVTNGKLDVNASIDTANIASENTLVSLNAKFPTIGQNLSSGSLSVVQSSDKPFNVTAKDLDIRKLDQADTVTVIAKSLDVRPLVSSDVVTSEVTKVPFLSGVMWNNEKVQNKGVSVACDVQYCSKLSMFGSSEKPTSLSVSVSLDKTNWYDAGIIYKIGGSGGQFHIYFETGCRYVRLTSSNETIMTALYCAKM